MNVTSAAVTTMKSLFDTCNCMVDSDVGRGDLRYEQFGCHSVILGQVISWSCSGSCIVVGMGKHNCMWFQEWAV